jgi:hypothetical protein
MNLNCRRPLFLMMFVPDDIGGHQVGRELNAAELQARASAAPG